MHRKLIKWGSSETIIISLPRKWIKDNNLDENNMVKIDTNPDGSLTIIPEKVSPTEDKDLEALIKIKDVDDIENIRLRLMTKYLDGCDVIKIESVTNEFPSNIRTQMESIIRPLMGTEIMGISSKVIIIKNVMSVEASNLFNLIKMSSDLTIELGKSVQKYLENPEMDNTEAAYDWQGIEKYYYRIIREQRKSLLHPAILAKMDITLQDTLDFSFYITDLYEIAESLKYIMDTIRKYGVTQDEFGVRTYLKNVLILVMESIDSFLFNNSQKAIETFKRIKIELPKKREIENKVDATENLSKIPKHLTYQILLDQTERMLDYSEDIVLAALRRAI
jgi:phosphate uptake regulator